MRKWAHLVLVFALAVAAHAETLDRIAVTVGNYVISEQDILRDLRIAAFLDDKPADLGGARKREAADRLIEQYLVLRDAAEVRAALPSAEVAKPMLASVKARYPSDAAFREALAKAEITETALEAHLLTGLRMLRYTNVRFRPQIQLSEEGLRAYYEALTSQSPEQPARSFEESREQIEKLLADQQTMQSLDDWVKMIRDEVQIVYRETVFR
jgi:hypothetical protein